jgi:hypothetical protein
LLVQDYPDLVSEYMITLDDEVHQYTRDACDLVARATLLEPVCCLGTSHFEETPIQYLNFFSFFPLLT